MPKAEGPFEVLEKVNDNAYKVNLPCNFGVSATSSRQLPSRFEDQIFSTRGG